MNDVDLRIGGTTAASSLPQLSADTAPALAEASAVCSYTEWDPLEEVIVGTIGGVTVPPLTHEMKVMVRRDYWDYYRTHAGEPYP